jgi:hypothetical protein
MAYYKEAIELCNKGRALYNGNKKQQSLILYTEGIKNYIELYREDKNIARKQQHYLDIHKMFEVAENIKVEIQMSKCPPVPQTPLSPVRELEEELEGIKISVQET